MTQQIISPPGGVSNARLIDTIILSEAVQNFDFPYQLIEGMGYILKARIINDEPSLLATYSHRFNTAAADGERQYIIANGIAVQANRGGGSNYGKGPAGTTVTIDVEIPFTQTGADRILDFENKDINPGAVEHWDGVLRLTTPANNVPLTSIGVGSDRLLGIGVNSIFKLWEQD